MKIDYRIANNTNIGKWSSNKHDNKSKTHCDMCGSKLWVKPDGKSLYCDKEHRERTVCKCGLKCNYTRTTYEKTNNLFCNNSRLEAFNKFIMSV